jgi:CDP-6-deoxy-D-xylo-4-hexulose-3-dehydrase
MRKSDNLSNSDNIMQGGVLLACHHGLNEEMIAHMHSTIEEFLKTKI